MSCKTILLIEDDKTIRETLQQILEIEGYPTQTAANGKEGLEMLSTLKSPCLILLDLMMPIMNGWEFVEALRKDDILATLPVVVITAFGERASSIQATGIIKKPVDLDALLRTVQYYCR